MNKERYLSLLKLATTIAIVVGLMIHVGGFMSGVTGFFFRSSGNDTSFSDDYSGVKEIDIDVDLMNITIKKGSSFTVDYQGNEKLKPKIKMDEKDGKLSITQSSSIKKVKNSYKSELTITVPDGTVFEKIIVNADLGNLVMSDVTCEDLELDLDLGNVDATRVKAEELTVDADLGNVEFHESTIGEADIDADLGNISLELTDDVKSYKIEAEASMGNIEIDGEKVKNDYEQSGDLGKIKLNCDMGNISVYTK